MHTWEDGISRCSSQIWNWSLFSRGVQMCIHHTQAHTEDTHVNRPLHVGARMSFPVSKAFSQRSNREDSRRKYIRQVSLFYVRDADVRCTSGKKSICEPSEISTVFTIPPTEIVLFLPVEPHLCFTSRQFADAHIRTTCLAFFLFICLHRCSRTSS